jgi:hypothetical protein
MPTTTGCCVARLAVLILLVVLAGGCAGQTDKPTAAAPGTTTTTVAPTTTTLPPLTAKELAWLKAIPTVGRKIEQRIGAVSNLTPSAMARLATTFRSCARELVRGGPPSDRLEPVYVLVKKACKEYDKGAACFATAASVGIPFAGSPGERRQSRAIDCGFAAPGKAGVALADAESKGMEIKTEAG